MAFALMKTCPEGSEKRNKKKNFFYSVILFPLPSSLLKDAK
jgi:hypothetical protein